MKRLQFMFTSVVLAALFAGGILAFMEIATSKGYNDSQDAAAFSCPRHPFFVFEKQGKCPVCGMNLVRKQTQESAFEAGVGHGQQKTVYACPMHTNFIADKPRTCSICGMDLVKKQIQQSATDEVSGVYISVDKQKLIGVATDKVTRRNLSLKIRAPARVVLDQELYITQVAYFGADVSDIEAWNEIYKDLLVSGISPEEVYVLNKNRQAQEFYNTQRAYLGANVPKIEAKNEIHQELLNLGMTADEVYTLNNGGKPDKSLTTFGYGNDVWIYASIYKNDMQLVKPGQQVEIIPPGPLGEKVFGTVTGVSKTIDPQSRMARVRVRVKDVPPAKVWFQEERRLRLNTVLSVVFTYELGEKLSIPANAIMDTGSRKIVYVAKDNMFTAREVMLGPNAGDYYEVFSGVEENEEVVTSGNFLIDSESHLKGVL